MQPGTLVGNLSRATLLEMLARADSPGVVATTTLRMLASSDQAALRSSPFLGSRLTAESGESWDEGTVLHALTELSVAVEASGHGEDHMVTVQNLEPSLAQAALVELAVEKGWAEESPDGRAVWVRFDRLDAGWIGSLLQRIKAVFKGRARRPAPQTQPDALPNTCRVALVGDWGTGLYGAPAFRNWAAGRNDLDAVVHLGDTYYAGTKSEIKKRLKAFWPVPEAANVQTLSRFLNGNHEMYSGGKAYFDLIRNFPQAVEQASSCFAMQNDHWLILALDTAWHGFAVEPMMHSGHLDKSQTKWLIDMVKGCGDRKVVLLSHHQPFHFPHDQNPELTSRLQALWDLDRVRFWFWGHEHYGVRYDRCQFGFEGRCVGHGGMPATPNDHVRHHALQTVPIAGTSCSWRRIESRVAKDSGLRTWVLDGPNPLIDARRPERFLPHGWVVIELDGPSLKEEWFLADGEVSVPLP